MISKGYAMIAMSEFMNEFCIHNNYGSFPLEKFHLVGGTSVGGAAALIASQFPTP